MSQSGYSEEDNRPMIHVVGVGGSGVNAVNRMIGEGLGGVGFIAVDTLNDSLMHSKAKTRVRLGDALVHGQGAGGNAELGQQAAEESADELHEVLRLCDLTFVVCGLGGGTGSGAAPVIARIAREQGSLVLGLVTLPFGSEGVQRQHVADAGLDALNAEVDALFVIANDRLPQIVDRTLSLQQMHLLADALLCEAVRGISEVIAVPALINIDTRDLRTLFSGKGVARISLGRSSGEARARRAARTAVTSPLLEGQLHRARSVYFTLAGGVDLSLFEFNEVAAIITENAHPEVNLVFGCQLEETMGDAVRITLYAAGFDDDDGQSEAFPVRTL